MARRFESRLGRLEQQQAPSPSWRAYIGRPFREWPDDALDALIRCEDGLDADPLTEAELQLLDATCAAEPLA